MEGFQIRCKDPKASYSRFLVVCWSLSVNPHQTPKNSAEIREATLHLRGALVEIAFVKVWTGQDGSHVVSGTYSGPYHQYSDKGNWKPPM